MDQTKSLWNEILSFIQHQRAVEKYFTTKTIIATEIMFSW